MELPRRQFLHLAASTAALGALLRDALAVDYPTRPVRLIVGFPVPAALPTFWRVYSVRGCRTGLGSNLSSKTSLAPAQISPLKWL